MSRSHNKTNNVTVEECEEFCELADEGVPIPIIASDSRFSIYTVRKHIADRCDHRDPTQGNAGQTCSFCGEENVTYRTHLPCEGVDPLE